MDQKSKEFLSWLANRLVFKHGYSSDDPVVAKLNSLSSSKDDIDLNQDDLDKILSKYYVGFFLDKTDDMNLGYSEKERNDIRSNMKLLVIDIINKNIPEKAILQ